MSGMWNKAQAAARSARVLLEAGDPNGAVNRAYYAMFDAARVALVAIDPKLDAVKRHATVISRFGLYLVQSGKLDAELGRMLNEAESLRLTADYENEFIDAGEARIVVERMEQFMAAVQSLLSSEAP